MIKRFTLENVLIEEPVEVPETIAPEDNRTGETEAQAVELSADITVSDEQLQNGDDEKKPEYYQILLSRLQSWAVDDKIALHQGGVWFVQVIGEKTYYLPGEDSSIGSFAAYKFDESAIEALEPIVRGFDGKYYLESQVPETPVPNYQELRAAAYPDIREYLDAQVKLNSEDEALIAEGQTQLEAYYQACLAVKAQYPKPENNNKS